MGLLFGKRKRDEKKLLNYLIEENLDFGSKMVRHVTNYIEKHPELKNDQELIVFETRWLAFSCCLNGMTVWSDVKTSDYWFGKLNEEFDAKFPKAVFKKHCPDIFEFRVLVYKRAFEYYMNQTSEHVKNQHAEISIEKVMDHIAGAVRLGVNGCAQFFPNKYSKEYQVSLETMKDDSWGVIHPFLEELIHINTWFWIDYFQKNRPLKK